MKYSNEIIEKAKQELLAQFKNLCNIGYGKIEISFNVGKGNILIVPSPYIRIDNKDLTGKIEGGITEL